MVQGLILVEANLQAFYQLKLSCIGYIKKYGQVTVETID